MKDLINGIFAVILVIIFVGCPSYFIGQVAEKEVNIQLMKEYCINKEFKTTDEYINCLQKEPIK